MRFATLLIMIAISSGGTLAWADDEADQLIQATADAVSTAIARLNTGEMRLEYHWVWNTLDHKRTKPCIETGNVVSHVIWKDDRQYADFTVQSICRFKDTGAIDHGTNKPTHVQVIRDPKFEFKAMGQMAIFRTTNLNRPDGDHHHFFNARGAWFNPNLHEGYHHLEFLKPSPEMTSRVVRDTEHPRQFRIERESTRGFRSHYVIDLDQGGMVVETGFISPKNLYGSHGKWHWRQDSHGVWYADKLSVRLTPGASPDDTIKEHTVTVTSFDSQPKIAADRFQRSSIKLPKGTYLREHTEQGRKTSYVGGKPPQEGVNLDRLIDDAQSGFAAPREKP